MPARPADALVPAVAPAPDAALGGARKILIADDNIDAAESLSQLLRTLGYETRVANDGREALAAFTAFAPDAALLDIGMPELSGYEVAERIRKMPRGSQVLLAALSGWGQQHDKRRSTAAGFDLHFTKPVDPEALMAALRKMLPTGDVTA